MFLSTTDFPNASQHNLPLDMPLSDRVVLILQWVVLATVSQLTDICGIRANIINIVCFVKQGFKDTVNVTFLGAVILVLRVYLVDNSQNQTPTLLALFSADVVFILRK